MSPTTVRNISLANAAIQHAVYFLEIDAYAQAASYFRYAAEQFQSCADGLTTVEPSTSAKLQR